jgi:hypothetical protein
MLESLVNNRDLTVRQNHLLLYLFVVVGMVVLCWIPAVEMEVCHDDDKIIYKHPVYKHEMDLIPIQDDHRNRTIFLLLDFYNKLKFKNKFGKI